MKKVLFVIFCCMLCNVANCQSVEDAYYYVDYSKALICEMNEESFAVVEKDWFKDKPVISSIMLKEIIKKAAKYLPYDKDSRNKVVVQIKKISSKGSFNSDLVLLNDENETIIKIENVSYTSESAIGTKLRLIKIGAQNEGKKLGNALKKKMKRLMQ